MAVEVRTPVFEVPEGAKVFRVARVVGAEGTTYLKGDAGLSLTVKAFDLDAGVNANKNITTGTNLPATGDITSSLRKDGYWDGLDGTGYNLLHGLDLSVLLDPADLSTTREPEGGRKILVEYKVTSTALGTAYVRAIYIIIGKET